MDLKNVSFDLKKVADKKDWFCENWGMAKMGIEALRGMVKNPILKTILQLVINLGDMFKEKYC